MPIDTTTAAAAGLVGTTNTQRPILTPPDGCTQPFPGTATPAQPGVYLRRYRWHWLYCYWDGHWRPGERTPDAAAGLHDDGPAMSQDLPWCGLSSPPAGGYGSAAC